jgi:UDP-N-acetyl-D-mannosaminuronic acid dehydrogenase
MENTYRDVNIALSNELALICEKINVNVNEVITAANYHPRVNLHTPGPGVGGHCIPVDPYFLIEIAEKYGVPAKLISSSREINNSMPEHVIQLISSSDKTIKSVGLLGQVYKGNVDDIRETPTKKVIELLLKENYDVFVHDPLVKEEVIETFNVDSVSFEDALNCDCVILMTDHDLYKTIEPDMLKNKFIIVTRPILSSEKFRNKGIDFQAIGDIAFE